MSIRNRLTVKLALAALAAIAIAAPLSAQEPNTGPWDLAELKQTPKVTWEKSDGPLRELYYEGEPYQGKPTRVFAYYAVPEGASKEHPVPAMVLIHGGGGTAFSEWAQLWADRGYAAIAMDLAGCGPERKRLEDGGPDQDGRSKFQAIEEGVKHAWPYHAVANVIRAVSLIRSFPEVDPERVGATGISWGGYLTCMVSGLDDRLKVAVPVYGCGFLHDNSAWLKVFAQMPDEDQREWVKNFDPSQYLPAARMPMLFVNGTNDFAYPLDSYQKSYRLPQGTRNLCVTVRMRHSHPAGWAPQEIGLFVDSILKQGEPLATLGSHQRDGKQVTVDVQSKLPLKSAQLHYTTDGGSWSQRKWQSAPAQLADGKITATLPADSGLVYFLTITDQRGAITSSEHEELPSP